MSRRRDVHIAFAKVKLLCSANHVVGYLVQQHWQNGGGDSYMVEPDGTTARRLPAGKVRLTCLDCGRAGTRRDLQVSAATAERLLATRGKQTYIIDG